MFGDIELKSGDEEWSPGILVRLLGHLMSSKLVQHWIVLDGPMSSSMMDLLTRVLSDTGLRLPNGEIVHLPGILLCFFLFVRYCLKYIHGACALQEFCFK